MHGPSLIQAAKTLFGSFPLNLPQAPPLPRGAANHTPSRLSRLAPSARNARVEGRSTPLLADPEKRGSVAAHRFLGCTRPATLVYK